MKATDSRYPFTYACDYLRAFGGADANGVKMSRSEASTIREAVAKALGMSDEDLAKKLADHYIANESEVSEHSSKEFIRALGISA